MSRESNQIMSSRAEAPTEHAPAAPAQRVSVALIGPNNAHRKIVADALSASTDRTVHEFPAYPAKLSDVPSLMEQNFDVVMIDVDSDQSYALALVEKIAAFGNVTVMVYSRRDDPQLLLNCMRAGAREFLPLPSDEEPEATTAPPADSDHTYSHAEAAEPGIEPQPQLSDFATPGVPQTEGIESPTAGATASGEQAGPAQTEGFTPDFDEWDRMHLRALQSLDSKTRREVSPAKTPPVQRTGSEKKGETIGLHLVQTPPPAKKIEPPAKKIEPPARPEPEPAPASAKKPDEPIARPQSPVEPAQPLDSIKTENDWDQVWARAGQATAEAPQQTAGPADSKPASQTWLEALDNAPETIAPPRPKFDPSMLEPLITYEPEEKKHPNATQWMILAMGLGVLACLAVLYYFHPFGINSVSPAAAKVSTAQPPASGTEGTTEGSTSAPQADQPNSASSVAATESDATGETPAPVKRVSAAQMDAQLTAPAQIAPAIKRTARADEPPPPGGFTPAALESENALPGDVFSNSSQAKIVAPPSAISAGIAQGMLIHKTEPIYPPFARQTHVGGTVSLGATITKSGTIANLRVISGPVMLRDSALQAVKTWRYRPYTLNNQPVEVQTTINVVFSLDK